MNLRTFSAISAVSMLVLGGCVIVGTTPGGGNGGAGGDGNGGEATTSSTGGTGGVGGAGVGGGGGAGGGAGACAKTCAEAINDGVAVCESSPASLALYEALAKCTCERAAADPDPGCKEACTASVCSNMDPDAMCADCLQKAGCSDELGACSADF